MMDKGDQNAMLDGEAEIDKLLMMHMSKHHHEDEVPPLRNSAKSESPQIELELDINLPVVRRDSLKKKR